MSTTVNPVTGTVVIDTRSSDIKYNRVSSSRFLFYLQVFCLVAFLIACCYALYTHRYKGKPDVTVPENTLYNPKYK